jgi:4-hydroxy-2-oxoheptanedioate aldolase
MVGMDLPKNAFKAGITTGRCQIGLWSSLSSNITAELVASAGYDWIVLDGEHGPANELVTLSLLQAMQAGTASPIVRVAANDPVLIKRTLDVGAQTVIVPQIDSADQARAAAAAMRYPPCGVRGVGPMARASHYGAVTGYLKRAESELCLVAMCESRLGLGALPEIAATDGVDAVLVGPHDLAADMGHLGEPGAEEVVAAIARAVALIREAGKAAGVMVGREDEAAHWMRQGCAFVGCSSDAALLRAAATAAAARLRAARGESRGTESA